MSILLKKLYQEHRTMPIPRETTDIVRAGATLYSGFKTLPICNYMHNKFRNLPIDAEIDPQEYKDSYIGFPERYLAMGGFIAEVNDFDAVSIWTRPGTKDDIEDPKLDDKQFVQDFLVHTALLKEKVLGDTPAYHLFMLAKDLERNTKGSVRSIFEYYTAQADREGAAIYLEAVNEKCARVYEYFGFKRHGNITFGKGEVNAEGFPDKNGEGFTCYFMVYYSGQLPGECSFI